MAFSAYLSLVLRVGIIGETIIKALANIFGAPFSDNFVCLKGIKQLFIQFPLAVLSLIFLPIEAGLILLCDTIGMAISPYGYSNWKKSLCDNEVAT